jgi:molybdate/tungstate transport system ATP-binding protein
MRMIAGLQRVERGHVRIGGIDVTHLPPNKRGVVLVTPTSSISHLDVDSHIVWGARLNGRKVDRAYLLRTKSELGIDFDGTLGRLSLGMRARVVLATALISAPKAILVDEAFSNIHGREGFISSYGRLVKEISTDLIFTSQDEMDGALSDNLYLMENGTSHFAGRQIASD